MGSLSHITLSNSIHYNTPQAGEPQNTSEGDYEPVATNFRHRRESQSRTNTNINNPPITIDRSSYRGSKYLNMNTPIKLNFLCISIVILLALQIWNVIMMKHVEVKLSKATIKTENLPILKPCPLKDMLMMLTKKMDLIIKDTNYNLPYMIMNNQPPRDFELRKPKGIFIPFGTTAEIRTSRPMRPRSTPTIPKERKHSNYQKWKIKFHNSNYKKCNCTNFKV